MMFFPKALVSVALGFYFIHIFTAALPGEAQPAAKVESFVASDAAAKMPALPTTLRGFQEAFANLDAYEWGGGDIAVTTVLRDGRAVWFFGDTLTKRGGITWINRNTSLVQTGKVLRAANDGVQIIKNSTDAAGNDYVYWPIKVKETIYDGVVKVWCMKVRVGTESSWDFERVRPDEARIARVAVDDAGDMTFKSWMDEWVPNPTDPSAAPPDGSDVRAIESGHWAYMTITHFDLPLQDGKHLVTESQNWDDGHENTLDYRPFLYAR